MGTSSLYDWATLILSVVSFLMAFIYCRRVVYSYRTHHDDRAAVSLAKGVAFVVITFGLVISSLGLVTAEPEFAVAGLSLVRGTLIALLATLLLANVRPG